MIEVTISPSCREIMEEFGVTEEEVKLTVNTRDRGMADRGCTRLAAIHWFSEDRAVFVDTIISERSIEGEGSNRKVRFIRVDAHLAIELRAEIKKDSPPMENMLAVIAESFGVPVRCHPDSPYSTLYSGPCLFRANGGIDFDLYGDLDPGIDIGICGSFQPDDNWVDFAWVFNLAKYRKWHAQTIGGGNSN